MVECRGLVGEVVHRDRREAEFQVYVVPVSKTEGESVLGVALCGVGTELEGTDKLFNKQARSVSHEVVASSRGGRRRTYLE